MVWSLAWAVALGACGGPAPLLSETPASAGGEAGVADLPADDEVLCDGDQVVIGVLGGPPSVETAPARRAPREALVLPEDRESAPPRAPIAAFSAVEPLHRAATSVAVSPDVASDDTAAAVRELFRRVDEVRAATSRAMAGYQALFAHSTLGAEARTRAGDLLDEVAAIIASARFPLPADLEKQIAGAGADVRAAVLAAMHERIEEHLSRHIVGPWLCEAAIYYEAAATPRAREQLERYGSSFLASCP